MDAVHVLPVVAYFLRLPEEAAVFSRNDSVIVRMLGDLSIGRTLLPRKRPRELHQSYCF